MKKSIAILSLAAVLLLTTNRNEDASNFLKRGPSLEAASVIPEQVPDGSFLIFKMSEEEDTPWKDPWQWREIFRNVWRFWR